MKILLLGEYSNVHATLAEGLRALDHKVVVASNGDFWKGYPRDIDLQRGNGRLAGPLLELRVLACLPRFRDYDVVQIINPLFFELKAERHFPFFRYLRRRNKKIVLGAFGVDYYWVNENVMRRPLRYSDFNIGDTLRDDHEAMRCRRDWLDTKKEVLNRLCAAVADHIVTGLYEYDVCYRPHFPHKTTFIPLPIKVPKAPIKPLGEKVIIFAGISRGRSAYKGTDIMVRAAQDVVEKHHKEAELRIVEGVPFEEYCALQRDADIILDQLYSYTPAMNALQAMAQGIVCVGGGEEENYDILGEQELRPIINVLPSYESVYAALEHAILHREELMTKKAQSVEYVKRYHNYIAVAKRYEKMYLSL